MKRRGSALGILALSFLMIIMSSCYVRKVVQPAFYEFDHKDKVVFVRHSDRSITEVPIYKNISKGQARYLKYRSVIQNDSVVYVLRTLSGKDPQFRNDLILCKIALNDVQSIKIKRYSPGMTAVFGVGLGVAVVGTAGFVAILKIFTDEDNF